MNPVVTKIESFLKQYDELEKLNDEVSKEHSFLDKSLSNFYHRVEGIKITHVSQSHNLIKELKVLLDKRRDKKIEGILLRSTCDTLREKMGSLKKTTKSQIEKDEEVRQEIKDRALESPIKE